MSYKNKVKGAIGRVPPARGYLQKRQLQVQLAEKQNEASDLHAAVERLEKRNDEWAAEVRQLRGDAGTMHIIWPASEHDIVAANWHKPVAPPKVNRHKPPFTINWVVPPMGQVSGGNVDIFRTIGYLESKGHHCRVYFYDARGVPTLDDVKRVMGEYPPIKSELFYNAKTMKDCDAIFATNWITAYPVFNFKGAAKKFYYVQDFEPFFEPVGSYSILAENTYKFGFHGLTLGRWLSQKLSEQYGMQCDPFEFGVDTNEYKLTNPKPRKKILFYARPVSPRRGFELGVLALDTFHKQHPEYEINFLGWDITPYDIPFPYVNHGVLSVDKLNALYNECAAGLVLSFTNMSLLPLEMLASGCLPVMNNAKHTHLVNYADKLCYADPNPAALADALFKAVKDTRQPKAIADMAEYAKQFQWVDSNEHIEKLLLRELA